jgi:hypothetical protein
MARKISLTPDDAQKELRFLSKLILKCENLTLRNRYTARRSRLTQFLKKMDANVVIEQHERTIVYLRAQVNNLIGMLKDGNGMMKMSFDSPGRIEQPDEMHLSWYEEVYMDRSSTSQSRSASTVASLKVSKSADVDDIASRDVSKSTSKAKPKGKPSGGVSKITSKAKPKGKSKGKTDVGAGAVCNTSDVADMPPVSSIENNSIAPAEKNIEKNSIAPSVSQESAYVVEELYGGCELVSGFEIRESFDGIDDILFHSF